MFGCVQGFPDGFGYIMKRIGLLKQTVDTQGNGLRHPFAFGETAGDNHPLAGTNTRGFVRRKHALPLISQPTPQEALFPRRKRICLDTPQTKGMVKR